MSAQRDHLESCLKELKIKGTVLDVGGLAFPTCGRTKTWDVGEYNILDIKKESRGSQSEYVEDLNQVIIEVPEHDNVFCTEVMQFVFNPYQAMRNLNNFLKVGGKLFISFHFFFGFQPMKGTDYLRYTKGGFTRLLEETGFKIIKIKPMVHHNYGSETTYFVEAEKCQMI